MEISHNGMSRVLKDFWNCFSKGKGLRVADRWGPSISALFHGPGLRFRGPEKARRVVHLCTECTGAFNPVGAHVATRTDATAGGEEARSAWRTRGQRPIDATHSRAAPDRRGALAAVPDRLCGSRDYT